MFASRDDMRPILTGVRVEYTPERTRLVATDGHTLGLVERPSNSDDMLEPGSLVIQTDVIKQATSILPRTAEGVILQTTETEDEFRLGNVIFKPISKLPSAQRYPNYRAVLVKSVDGKPGVYNPEYMMRFAKAEKMLFDGKRYYANGLRFGYNGGTSACVILSRLVSEFYGLLMPIRSEPFDGIQDWIAADVDAEIAAKVIQTKKRDEIEHGPDKPIVETLQINFPKKEQPDGTGNGELSEAQPQAEGGALPEAGSQAAAGTGSGAVGEDMGGDSAPASEDIRESGSPVAGPEEGGKEEGGEAGEPSGTTDLR